MLAALFVIVGVACVLAMSSDTGASSPRGNRPAEGVIQLLQNRAVHQELKITEAQLPEVRDVVQAVRGRYREQFQELQQVSPAERGKRMPPLVEALNRELFADLGNVLNPAQIKRLKQIAWQARGFQAFVDPEVRAALALTEPETERLKSQAEAAREAAKQTLGGAPPRPDARTKIVALRRQAVEEAVTELGQERLQVWKNLVGAPFDVPPQAPPGGGGVGGGPRRPGGQSAGQGPFALDYDDDF
jgi:hypothetical protein